MVVLLCHWQGSVPIPRENLRPFTLASQESRRPQTPSRRWSRNVSFLLNGVLPFHVTHTKLSSHTSELSSQRTKTVFMLNKGFVHMVDDIFWNMGFKNAEAAEKVVMSSLLLFVFILIILIIFTASMCLGHSSTRLARTSQENCRHNRVTGRQVPYCASRWMAGLHSGNVWCSHYNTARGAQMRLGLNDCRRQRGNMTLPLLNKATLQNPAFLTAFPPQQWKNWTPVLFLIK